MENSISATVETADWKVERHVPAIAAPVSTRAEKTFDVEIAICPESSLVLSQRFPRHGLLQSVQAMDILGVTHDGVGIP